MLLAIGNGVLREATYGKCLPELHAHQLSTFIAAILFGTSVWLLSRKVVPGSLTQAVIIGVSWLVLTLCFEFLFGHYVMGHPWSRLWQDYDLLAGRAWPLLLVWVTLLPCLAYKVQAPAN